MENFHQAWKNSYGATDNSPPGLQKKCKQFPVELERRLPPLPRNYARVFLEGHGFIIDAQFNIMDIIEVFR